MNITLFGMIRYLACLQIIKSFDKLHFLAYSQYHHNFVSTHLETKISDFFYIFANGIL